MWRGIGLLLVIISHSCRLSPYLINYYIPLFFWCRAICTSRAEAMGKMWCTGEAPAGSVFWLQRVAAGVLPGNRTYLAGDGKICTRSAVLTLLPFDTTTHQDNVFLFTVANGAMWYLTAFFCDKSGYHLVIDRCLKSRRFLIGCLVVLTVLTMLLAELPILLPWSLDLAFVGTIFMIAGTLLQRADFFDRDWNLWVIIGILVFYLSLSRANPGINMSVREYGVYQAFSVPFFILIGITGSMLCIWVGKAFQNCIVGTVLAYIGQNTIVLLALHILGLEIFGDGSGKVYQYRRTDRRRVRPLPHGEGDGVCLRCLLFGKTLDGIKRALHGKHRG